MKRFTTLTAVAGALLLEGLPAAASDTVKESMVADSVHVRLVQKLGIDAGQIQVQMIGNRAVLMGVVDSRQTEELAEEVALSVPGVRRVKNKLILRKEPGPIDDTGNELKDALLEARVKHILMTEIGKNVMKIEVEAASGTVALRGHVRDAEVARAAVARAREIGGVRKVIDLLDSVSYSASR